MGQAHGLRRRDFLERAGAVLAGTALGIGGTYGGQAANSPGLRIAVMFAHPTPFSAVLQKYLPAHWPWPTEPLREFALFLQHLGFQGIDLNLAWALTPDSIFQALEGTGIVISNVGGSIQLQNPDSWARARGIEITGKCLQLASSLGVPTVGDHYTPFSETLQAEDQLVVDELKQLAPDMKKTGVEFLLEPMFNPKSTRPIDLQSHAVSVIQAVDAPGFKVVSDFWHMQMQKNDIGESLARYGKYTGAVHLGEGETRTEPGSHGFDYRPGFRALKKTGYSGWLTIECFSFSGNDPEAALGRALKYVHQQWSEA